MSRGPMIALNVVLFQTAWFACVLSAAHHAPWIGALTAAVVVIVHLGFADQPAREAVLISIAGLIGGAWDGALVNWAGFQYASGNWELSVAPYWIVAMWLSFATTVNVSLRWLKQRLVLGAVFGAVGGPLAFYTGHRLGAVNFENTSAAMLVLAFGWAVLVPALMAISERLDGMQARFGTVRAHNAT